MILFTSLDQFDCLTPLGPARCIGFLVDGDITEWLCDIHRTREPWWFRNEHFRFGQTVTNGGPEPSPFTRANGKLARQIKRYKDNGWL
jgi:hypothetical protein